MDNILLLHDEEYNKKKGLIVSIVLHLLLLLLCLFPYLNAEMPDQQPISGILVAFGTPEGGNSSEIAASTAESDATETSEVSEPTAAEDTKEAQPKPEKITETPKKTEPTPQAKPETTAEVTESLIVKKESEAKEKADAEAEAKAEAEHKKQAAAEKAREEARKKAEKEAAEKAQYQESKKQFSNLFGSGRGTNDAAGNEGDPAGDPNADNLKGMATGSGRIGGGLSDRGLVYEPDINDNSQKTGRVVIKICVDQNGKVSEAKFTQRGSTTTDQVLVDIATKAAAKYTFTPSDVDTQCGTITVDFKVGK